MKTLFLILFGGFVCFCCSRLGAQDQNNETALIRLRVNTAYDDSDDSIVLITKIVSTIPPVRGTLGPGVAPSRFILNNYGFGPTDLPKSYAVVEKAFLAENHWDRPEQAIAGPVLMPALPKRALTDPSRTNRWNGIAKINELGQLALTSVTREESRLAFRLRSVSAVDRRGSQSAVMDLSGLTISLADEIMADPILGGITKALARPLDIHLATSIDVACNDPGSAKPQILSNSEKSQLSQLLSQNYKRDAFLFVIDSGWPNQKSYTDSRQQLWTMLDSFWRRRFGVSLPHGQYPQKYTEPTCFHSRSIAAALSEFKYLDPYNHIKVIFIPMTREQDGTSVITDLLQTFYLYDLQNGTNVPPTSDVLKSSLDHATEVVNSVASQWVGGDLRTDKALLDAVMLIADEYATMRQTYVFINESWTAPHKEYYLQWPPDLHGAVVAAAGNDNKDVNEEQVDFADRAVRSKDTIAIINYDQTGQQSCNSSYLSDLAIANGIVISFDGNVSSTICGTSFSAPRVAWLLAADEVTRQQNQGNPSFWAIGLRKRLEDARDPAATNSYGKIFLHPTKLLLGPH